MKRKKIIMTLIMVIAISFAAALPVSAEYSSYGSEEAENLSDELLKENNADDLLDELPDEARDIFASLGIDDISYDTVVNIDTKTVFSSVTEFFSGEMISPIKYSVIVFGIISLISVITAAEGVSLSKSESMFSLAECLAVGTVVLIPFSQCVSSAGSVIKLSNNFMLSLIPVLTALVAISGNPTAALSCNTMIFALTQASATFSSFTQPSYTVTF